MDNLTVAKLRQICRNRHLHGYSKLRKHQLIQFIQQNSNDDAKIDDAKIDDADAKIDDTKIDDHKVDEDVHIEELTDGLPLDVFINYLNRDIKSALATKEYFRLFRKYHRYFNAFPDSFKNIIIKENTNYKLQNIVFEFMVHGDNNALALIHQIKPLFKINQDQIYSHNSFNTNSLAFIIENNMVKDPKAFLIFLDDHGFSQQVQSWAQNYILSHPHIMKRKHK